MKSFFYFLPLVMASPAVAKIVTRSVEYKSEGKTLEGFLAYDDSSTKGRPGVLVVHEWTGLNDYTKRRTTDLAKLGYIAFAADIYGKGIRPSSPAEAGKTAAIYKNDRGLMRKRAFAGLEELKKQKLVNKNKLAAIGYCFGGTTVLELARGGADLKGVVTFHGGLSQGEGIETERIIPKLLILHGADDPNVPPKEVTAFEDEMRTNKANWELVKYSGAVHAFTSPASGSDNSKGVAYNEQADRRSWIAMKNFFAEIF